MNARDMTRPPLPYGGVAGAWAGRVANSIARLRLGPAEVACLVVVLALVVFAVFARIIAPFGPFDIEPAKSVQGPSWEHWFGTDRVGRDVLSRLIYGSRVTLLVGFIPVAVGTVGGALVGLFSGYLSGKVDLVAQRVVDALMAFPPLVLALVVMAVLGSSTTNAIIAISIIIIPTNARVVRGTVLSVKNNAYVEAAKACGANNLRVMFHHILPNIMAPILVLGTMWLGAAIVVEASLSFLGLGSQPPSPSWGLMLSQHRDVAVRAPWLMLAPGLAIAIVVLAFNLLGDSLRDRWDPRLRGGL